MTFVRAQTSDGVGCRPRQDPILGAKTKGMFHSSETEGLGMPTSRQRAVFRRKRIGCGERRRRAGFRCRLSMRMMAGGWMVGGEVELVEEMQEAEM